MAIRNGNSGKQHAVVIGAGIAGLATAVGLRAEGWDVTVLEKADRLRDGGGAILLWPNALAALERLGLREAVEGIGTPVETMDFETAAGKKLWSLPCGGLGRRFGSRVLMAPRGELIRTLARAAGGIQFGARAVHVAPGSQPVVSAESGAELGPDVVLAADGIHSATAGAWDTGPLAPRRLGQVAWIATVPASHSRLGTDTTVALAGPGRRFAASPLRGNEVYWYATVTNSVLDELEGLEGLDSRDCVSKLFEGWAPPVAELIARATAEQIQRIDILDRPTGLPWRREGVAFLGDAAHPMCPDLGQGACQALEDAACMVRWLTFAPDTEQALAGWERERRPRAERFVRISRLAAIGSMVEHPTETQMRDLVSRVLLPLAGPLGMEALTHPAP